MSAASRTPEQLLDELRRELAAGYRARRRWRRLPTRTPVSWRRAAALVGALAAVGGSTAAATRTLFAPAPPVPRLQRLAAILASGDAPRGWWQLSVTRCARPTGSVSVLLRTAAGGAGSACGPVVQAPTELLGPHGAIAFAIVPAGAARVELALGAGRRTVAPIAADADALRAAHLPPGLRLYVTRLPPGRTVAAATVLDRAGDRLLVCQEDRCARP